MKMATQQEKSGPNNVSEFYHQILAKALVHFFQLKFLVITWSELRLSSSAWKNPAVTHKSLPKPVDMRKANMDFLHPCNANRVTELPGFKDQVLFNFIHGLLDVKVLTLEEPERGLTIVQLTHVDVPEEDSGRLSHPTTNEASTNTREVPSR